MDERDRIRSELVDSVASAYESCRYVGGPTHRCLSYPERASAVLAVAQACAAQTYGAFPDEAQEQKFVAHGLRVTESLAGS